MALWKDKPEDDGANEASEATLRRAADAVVSAAMVALGRAFADEDPLHQLRATHLLELARALRVDLRRGAWSPLAVLDRRQLRSALLVLEVLSHSEAPIPLA